MLTFNQLKKNLKKHPTPEKNINISILAENANQFIITSIQGFGVEYNYNITINNCGYDEVDLQILEPNSQLYSVDSDYTLIIPSTQKLLKTFYYLNEDERSSFSSNIIANYQLLIKTLVEKSDAKIILSNFLEINDSTFGNYASKTESSFLFQLRKINYELMLLSQEFTNLFINDIVSLQNQFGLPFIIDPKFYINSDISFSLDFLPHFAKNTFDIINSIEGNFNKCLILDLDNTLWGGVIGDDGIENIHIGSLGIGKAFSEFQLWIKQLKERGIILAVCSKNSEDIAKSPFLNHPEMILNLNDFAVFVANWESKVNNIKHIQSILNIGFDSIVFFDDNPFERNIVSENIEKITVPDLPEDPSEYLPFLRSLNLFETASVAKEDQIRTSLYQKEAKRVVYQKSFTTEGEYLSKLDMRSKIDSFNKFNTPRVSQLTQRSNQFNLRTQRYSTQDIEKISTSSKHIGLAFSLTDKFGDNGLIAVLILEKRNESELFIDTWLVSCRILKRDMESFILNTIVDKCEELNYTQIIGEFIPSTKNEIVTNHYKNLGFIKNDNTWALKTKNYSPKNNYISISK